jgi:alcohol dehydrogenase (cytochrome c)
MTLHRLRALALALLPPPTLLLSLVLSPTLLLPSTLLAQVPYERIAHARQDTANWLTYSGSYAAQRYSPLGQITPGNIERLRVTWTYQVGGGSLIETTPLVADGIMYLTEPPSTVTALDARTGERIWRWSPTLPDTITNIGFPRVNRGVALLDSTVFVGTLDAHLVALDAATGAVRWDVQAADNARGYSLTLAPLAIDGKVIVGVSGGEAGIRGFIDAYDAATGTRLWRFYTVPGPGQPGAETWGGAGSWQTGGGSTWVTGAFDPQLDLLYWGVGNPGPDWNGDDRPGDNLYTCSLVALQPTTGKLVWYFQFTPHDTHDWDATEIPVLFDAQLDGRPRKLVAMANRNGFYYLLDRETGEFLAGRPYSKQTWARGLDAKGRPQVIPGTEPSVQGTLVWPSLQGATNWFSPSYSPRTGLFYVAVRQMGSVFFKGEADYQPGKPFMAGGEQARSGDDASGAVRALDPLTGKTVWSFDLLRPPWAGVMATAGGLVFGGTDGGEFYALDAASGIPLWRFNAGAAARSNPMSFALDGAQYVVMSAGRVVYVFGLAP